MSPVGPQTSSDQSKPLSCGLMFGRTAYASGSPRCDFLIEAYSQLLHFEAHRYHSIESFC